MRGIRRLLQLRDFVRDDVLQPLVQRETFARHPDRRRETRLQRQLAVLLREERQAGRLTGNAGRERTARGKARHRLAVGPEVHVTRRRAGRFLPRIDHHVQAVARTMYQDEATATEPRAARLDDRQRTRDRNGSVERIAALCENLEPRL